MATDTTVVERERAFVQALRLSTDTPPAPNLFERLLRLRRPSAAWQAVEARLASEPWSSLTRETIESDLREWHVLPKQMAEQSLEICRRAAAVAVGDGRIEDDEIATLRQLARIIHEGQ